MGANVNYPVLGSSVRKNMSSPSDTPGQRALEVAKSKDVAIFKKPIGVPRTSSKFRPKILSEDAYIEKMGEIIQKDFFPYLEKLKAQNEFLDALEQNDVKRMRQLYEKYSSGRPVTERPVSPATFETPLRDDKTMNDEDKTIEREAQARVKAPSKREEQAKNRIGLDAYLYNHTSEDNASFEEMMEEAQKRHRLKYAWLYENEEKSKALMMKKENDMLLPIEGKGTRPSQLDSWSYTNKNYIMYIPDGIELTPEEKIQQAKSKQEIVYDNTRLRKNPFNEQQNKETIDELAKTQSKANDGKIGVDGKEVVKSNTPQVNGFSFVATPSPRPGECESPLMTWGEIEGTPFRLDGGDTPLLRTSQGPSFKMAEPPKREQLALQLAEKAGERHRDRKNKALEAARRSLATPSPQSLSAIDRLSTMSPAARRLATQRLKISTTPSPRKILSRTPYIGIKTPSTPRTRTPGFGGKSQTVKSLSGSGLQNQGPVLTDNLLNLPLQRQRASDFFDK
ncbi:protein DGCR14 homolog [Orussus abietinus]|uniref:protein DGCR14 homolog n=1 Tax=Orussus abietinus TaxID=222816 RepID=UPI000626A4F0|nr:protein DGCR14 homolog [Orussus abietinus]